MTFLRLSALLLFSAFSLCAHADPLVVDFLKVLPPPPADDSPAGMADLDTVLGVQLGRTEAQVKEAHRVERQSPTSFARPVFGEWFHSRDFPKTLEAIHRIERRAGPVCDAAKAHWDRARPYERDAGVEPVVSHPGNASYPSGHSFGAAMWGFIFSKAFPDKAEAFQREVHKAMWGRVLGGAHYPSDTEAGLLLAQAVGRELAKDSEFDQAIRQIRREVGPHLKKQARKPAHP
ncbi:phosphatase PAP2 family protein [Haloferula sargassicola]|uniref:Acid phosphatase n=1 Tax=Haloferula sargassicola TaxID=490096 RepID=A0ABP9UTY2_9BACT